MSVTYYVALPFIPCEEGLAPGEASECPSAAAAVRKAEAMAAQDGIVGALAFSRTGDPNIGEFSEAVVLKSFGDVPNELPQG